jgi:hypothetical protein
MNVNRCADFSPQKEAIFPKIGKFTLKSNFLDEMGVFWIS